MGVSSAIRYAAIVAAALALPAQAAELKLICDGSAGADRDSTSFTPFGVVTSERRISFDDSVSVEMDSDYSGRIRLPRKILPMVKSGDGGWFTLSEVRSTTDSIEARVKLNMFNKPRIRIDRISGRITIQGPTGDFAGQCAPYDPTTVERKF